MKTILSVRRSLSRSLWLSLIAASWSSCAAVGQESDVAPLPTDAAQVADKQKRELLARILKQTGEARDQLTAQALGTETQTLQHAVVDDLQALIDLLKKSPPPPKNNDSNPSPNADSSSSDPSEEQQSSQDQQSKSKSSPSKGTGGGRDRQQPQDSDERDGPSREAKARADRKSRLENDIWGHLPPALREELLNTYGERMLPQYEEFVRKFYDALSEPGRARKR